MTKSIAKGKIIDIATSMGFILDYDQFDVDGKEWIRFVLNDELDEKDLRWIWWKDNSLETNLSRGAKILFKAGQKAKIAQLNKFDTIPWNTVLN